jgi:hypothetical protein
MFDPPAELALRSIEMSVAGFPNRCFVDAGEDNDDPDVAGGREDSPRHPASEEAR